MPFGLTPAGFVIKTLDQIVADLGSAELTLISPSLDLQPTALMGVINGIYAQALADLWQLAGALYNGMDPDQAAGDQETSLALITGTVRLAATETIVTCTINVNAGFSASIGTMFASIVGNPTAIFTNVTAVPVSGGGNITGVVFQCTQTGPIQALAGTLTVIAQPLANWNTITNPTAGTIGMDIETDAALRLRREEELATSGAATADALRADVLNNMQPPATVASTINVQVLFNDTDFVDVNGLTPHSFEVIARAPGAPAGDDQLLANLILVSKAAGDGTYGLTSKTAEDSQGNIDTIRFTRPTDVPLYIDITIVRDLTIYPTDGDTQIKNALVAFGNLHYAPGVDVIVLQLLAEAFNVVGVVDVTAFKVDTIFVPVNTANIAIGIRQTAALDAVRIRVF